ncbi:MAG: hypothetical protein Q8S45_12765 [Lutibacter sp.]|nr:hypothetical protein [Lutibacter sp.]
MTALKTKLLIGTKESIQFAIGAAMIVFFQAGLALLFADILIQNPWIIEKLKVGAIFVFFGLSISFYMLTRRKKSKEIAPKRGAFLLQGMGMSIINMLAIPFYLGVGIFLIDSGILVLEKPFIFLFIVGATLGSFLLFFTYILLANQIIKRFYFIAKNINYILSLLFLCLGIITIIKVIT